MIKIFRLMLLTALTMLCGSTFAAETVVTWVAADQGYSNALEVTTMTVDDNITMVANQGTNNNNAPKYYNTGTAIRLYGGNTLAVNGVEGVTIKKIVLTFGADDKNNEITTDVETYDNGTWTGESQNVVFTIGGTSGHRRIAAVEVTYEVAEATATESSVTWNASAEVSQGTFNVGDDLTLKWEEASGDQAPSYNSSKTAVSMKKNNKLTVAGADANVTISEIVITFHSSSDPGLSANVGSTTSSYADNTTTWTGEANSVTFTAGGTRYIKSIKVTYTGKAATVVKAPVLNITNSNIADTYNMDTNPVFVVYYENTGNAAAENAALTLYVDGNANKTETIGQIAMGATNQWKNMKYDLTNLAAGEHQVYLSLTADNADAFTTEAKTVTFTKAAPEATFIVTADNVTVPYDATSFEVKATVTNTSDVAANGVQMLLQRNAQNVVDPQTFDFAANETKQVTFTVTAPEGGFAAGETKYWVVVKAYEKTKAQQEVTVTVAEAPVVEKKDLAITDITGTLDLANATNNVRVIVQNNGNVDIADAPVTLKAGEKTLGSATVSAVAGQSGWCNIAVASEGLTAGELDVTATVTVEGDETPADNTMEATLTVNAAAAPEATFTVAAENVNVAYGAESFDIVAKITNTSEVDATDVAVKLLKGITEVETKTVATLAAGAEATVTFTVTEIGEAGKTATYYVQAPKNQSQAEVVVTFEAAPVEQTVDMALTQIQGVQEINLNQENTVLVWYKNEGNVATTATISATLNGTALTAQTVENVAAEAQNYVAFTLPVEGLTTGETATFEATITAENDVNAENNTLSKELTIVSSEVEPTAEIMINPIRGWNVEAGEQEISVTVSVFNQGTVDAKDVKIELYHSYGDGLVEPQTVDIAKDGGYKMLTFKFNYTFETGKSYDFTVYTNFADSNADDNMRTFTLTCPARVANVTINKIANIEATTADEVKINATLKNNSDFAAKQVKIGVYKVENLQFQIVGIMQTVEEIAAGAEENVEFNLGQLEVGNYTYYVRIVSVDGNATTTQRDVTVKVTETVVPEINVALNQIQGISNIDLAEGAVNNITVWVSNAGNVDANAAISVKLNETELDAQTVNVKAGQNANAAFTLPTEGLVAGEKATLVATVTVEGNVSETTTLTREYDVVNSSVATEPVFEISAAPVEVEFGTEKFDVVATVKNVSEVAAENVEVKLFYNGVIATQTVAAIAANGEATVTFADVVNPFNKAGEYTMFVMAPKAQAEVSVTVKPEPVIEKTEVALTAIQGISNIDLAEGANNTISVWVENTGNVDADAVISVSLNGTALEAQTVNVKAGRNGGASFILPTEGLVAGEKATVVATVSVEGNVSEAVTLTREYDVVNSSVATEPVFEIAAAPVEIEFGAEKFTVNATVKNISEIAAENVEVKLFYNDVVATQTIETLAAGAEAPVSFADVENPFTKAGTYTMYVQAPKAQAEVIVTVKPEPVAEVVDLAVTSIGGAIDLSAEVCYVNVFVENKGTVDVADAVVTLTTGETSLGSAIVTVKAGASAFCSIPVSTENLMPGELEVVATVEVENDVDPDNNTYSYTYTVAVPEATLSVTVQEVLVGLNQNQFDIVVEVENLSTRFDAENVEVKLMKDANTDLETKTIAKVAAASKARVIFTLDNDYTTVGTYNDEFLVVVGSIVKYVKVTVTEATAIEALKAKYGNDVQIFTLSGKKTDNVKKGLYIINGKKMVVK